MNEKTSETHPLLVIRHRSPLPRREHALLRRLRLVPKHVLDEGRVGPYPLQKHEVRAERFLGRVRVLDVPLARLARLALRLPEHVLALDVVRGERRHVLCVLALARFFRVLGTSLVRLHGAISRANPARNGSATKIGVSIGSHGVSSAAPQSDEDAMDGRKSGFACMGRKGDRARYQGEGNE